ncbi:uncharacterized protein METZ01_LOCUS253703, partial [marine metagenome]
MIVLIGRSVRFLAGLTAGPFGLIKFFSWIKLNLTCPFFWIGATGFCVVDGDLWKTFDLQG